MRLLLDMNLSPTWVTFLAARGIDAVHWSSVGAANAPDTEVLAYARQNTLVLFTHDLDFGVLLALTRGTGPSVIQIRTQFVMPEDVGQLLLDVLSRFGGALATGALVTVDHAATRARVLPLR